MTNQPEVDLTGLPIHRQYRELSYRKVLAALCPERARLVRFKYSRYAPTCYELAS